MSDLTCYRCSAWPCICKDGQTIIHGDCREVLPLLSYDNVITDPPYMIGAHSTGSQQNKTGGWGDMMNSAAFYEGWLMECKKAVDSRGFIAMFGNWRSIPTYLRAFSTVGLAATSCVCWDKAWIGPAYTNAFRPTWELILVSAHAESLLLDRSASDLYTCKWLAGACQTTGHKAEKPVELMQWLVSKLSTESQRVLDPFLGSGTTLRACKDLGRRGIGIEIEERYCEIAANRLRQEVLF